MGKTTRLFPLCMIPQVSIHSGRGDGACFMKNHLPRMPLG
jgi:hypothetical protein